MRKTARVKVAIALGVAIGGVVVISSLNKAEAQPQYFKAFSAKYEGLADQAKELKCGVCHGKKKTDRNNYAKALEKALGEKKVKDAEKINEALTKIEKEKSAVEGKTFGDLIKDGKIPGEKIE